ncbi:glutathione S-transferase N-terminal domain-containing protein [Stenotrophomonas sp. YAU14D1_LEIMI4_1]|uniref:glutathione S-transferase family protein n=1 Tax=Stenotrophomonas sp. YAU14D1_LEIMI4_1 TaxID=2072407 RepID=UPI000D53EB11|nr:glutathione S-transferase N-terminal domain-containing protein [Stenotrophomonas sp. YAU14D1_LEIMI4_1]AWH26925.1 glutathione S-transferase [Stenotrophomonas sp. YAU14D1_LEIMI4_1]
MHDPSLHLYTDSSPNGFKATIALEELGLPYQLHHVRIDQGQHRSADFLALNPHGRIPVLVDRAQGRVVFESAAILLYLAEHAQALLPRDASARWDALTWLMFHAASVGPILGQRVHFEHFADERYLPAVQRYQRLSDDAFAVLDARLAKHQYLAGTEYSIADIAHFAWLHIADIIDMDFRRYPSLWRWYQQVGARPAVQRGVRIPEPATGP